MSQQEREAARQSIDVLQGLNHSHVLGVHSSWVRYVCYFSPLLRTHSRVFVTLKQVLSREKRTMGCIYCLYLCVIYELFVIAQSDT